MDGRWRTADRQSDNAAIIPARCRMASRLTVGTSCPVGQPPGNAREALTEKLMMYALNRELEYYDMPQVRGVVRAAAKDNYKFSSIVRGIVNTEAFRKQDCATERICEAGISY
jgi:hypothetical protein